MAFVVARQEEQEQQEAWLYPSEFVVTNFRIPDKASGKLRGFSFQGMPYWPAIYDTDAEAILLMTGRQVAKSTMVGNMQLTRAVTHEHHQSLYVAPTEIQRSEYGKTRLDEPIHFSPYLKSYYDRGASAATYKRFRETGSIIRLRNAFHNADRTRGLTADELILDETQDIYYDNIPVIEQVLFTSKRARRVYAGTPKSDENTLTYLWYNRSTQCEWMVPCTRHAHVVWNISTEENLPSRPEDGLVCRKCKKPIDYQHSMAHWAAMEPNPVAKIPFQGFRVPQLISPFASWRTILDQYQNNPRRKFFNEVLGLPFGSGDRPITKAQIQAACVPDTSMGELPLPKNRTWFVSRREMRTFLGVDWGSGENTYTYLTVGGYYGGDDLRVAYTHRLVGAELEPLNQIETVIDATNLYGCEKVVADYGGGMDRNDALLRRLGPQKFFRLQYVNQRAALLWDSKLGRFMGKRTELMLMVFEAIKRLQVLLPRWEEVENDLAKEILSVTTEYNKSGDTTYARNPNVPDDGMHSLVYMIVASVLSIPRKDFVLPVLKTELNTDPNVEGESWLHHPTDSEVQRYS